MTMTMTAPRTTTALTLLLLASSVVVDAWISTPPSFLTSHPSPSVTSISALYDSLDANNDFYVPSSDSSNTAVLSQSDLSRLTQLQNRQLKQLPLLLVQDSLLPGQTMELSSTDGKFQTMVSRLLSKNNDNNDNDNNQNDEQLLCVVGMHPTNPGEPLNIGVSVTIDSIQVLRGSSSDDGHVLLTVRGKHVVDVQGQPRFDQRHCCFLTNVEIAQDDDDAFAAMLSSRQQDAKTKAATTWYNDLVPLIQEWEIAVSDLVSSGGSGGSGVVVDTSTVVDATTVSTRVHAVAALLNPNSAVLPATSMEIRPALLACRNDYDRLHLVHTALQVSIQQLTQ
eukprot:CAMPEP_0119006208 /NCGR_PEP_ID=MMETSP1176-20130426/2167_1 /TAXON_ID=265551 /ORGANISM="Synedropsis recta cf, Strain CCMP1620" /LENGTH=336 /DNA_ID=CAMNT_0006958101 /DNA_START=75 /DNA_END=1085 /DNA_ORIENTATION=+